MRALCKIAPQEGAIALREVTVPEPGPGEVLLAVQAAGICGTDLHIHRWTPWIAGRMKTPMVMGHEMSGIVEAVGEGVERLGPGDHVSIESHIPCGQCYTCRTGFAHVCPRTRYPGIDIPGGFAPFVALPERILWKNPKSLSHQEAALFEPFGIAVHASLAGCGVAGRHVLIAGCGPIGLMNIAAARALGARRIMASDISPERLAFAEKLGADRVVNVGEEDVLDAAREMTGGNGMDVAIEYSGAAQSLARIGDCLAGGGELRLVGVPAGPAEVDFERWILRGITVHNIHGRRLFGTWETASRLVADKAVDLRPFISHVLPLEDAARGFDLLFQGAAIKVLLDPQG